MRELRRGKGYTQVRMQMPTGIDQSAYSKLEFGKRSLSFEQCRLLAAALDTSMDLSGGPHRRPAPLSPREESIGPAFPSDHRTAKRLPHPFRVGEPFPAGNYSSCRAFAAAMAFSWAAGGQSSYRTKWKVKEPRDWVMARRSMA